MAKSNVTPIRAAGAVSQDRRHRSRKSAPASAPDTSAAQQAHDILFGEVHGTLALLRSAIDSQDDGCSSAPDIDCISCGGAERAAKGAVVRLREVTRLLGEYGSDLQKIIDRLYAVVNLVELAAHALAAEGALRGSVTSYPALTALEIAEKDSYELSCLLDEWIVSGSKRASAATTGAAR